MKKNTELNYGRQIIGAWTRRYISSLESNDIKVLDIGCGHGFDLENINKNSGKDLKMFGIEIWPEYASKAREKGINVSIIDIESEKFPFEDNYFDLIVINQVLEHTKEIFYIINEANRILKTGGRLIIGVPNLAALHNRILLCIGKQPACIKLESAHVRGFTKKALISFVENRGFTKKNFSGSNFYPFPKKIATALSKVFPTLAVCIFAEFEKISQKDKDKTLGGEYIESNFRI